MPDKTLPICIVGSGLSGISAAKALVDRGAKVLMIDPGMDLPDDISQHICQIGRKPAWQWTDRDRSSMSAGVKSSTKGVEEKRLFGSDFSSRGLDWYPVEKSNTTFYMSFAKSGLGNIWGAGLLPMIAEEMNGWPITFEELQPHYQNVLKFMPMSGQHDSLEELFPLVDVASFHAPSRQAASMFARTNKHSEKLRRHGFFIGASRLAGRFHGRSEGYDCQYCGMCMHGCPYGIIYTSRDTLEELMHSPNFSYYTGVVATGITQSGDNVELHGKDLSGNRIEPIKTKRILLACGPFSTARIILETLRLYDTELYLNTTDQYYLPFMSITGLPGIEYENLHTMCQAFWVVKNSKISPYSIHASMYTYNDLFSQALENILGRLHEPLYPIVNSVLSRLYFAITYLHSAHSGTLKVKLLNNAKKTLYVEGQPNPESIKIFNSVRRLWMRTSMYTGLLPAPFYNGTRLPGAGNHSGCSFPMNKNPRGLQTDTLGRIPGLERVHIVDSSVFPSITATTITFSIMANAYRIACEISDQKL